MDRLENAGFFEVRDIANLFGAYLSALAMVSADNLMLARLGPEAIQSIAARQILSEGRRGVIDEATLCASAVQAVRAAVQSLGLMAHLGCQSGSARIV